MGPASGRGADQAVLAEKISYLEWHPGNDIGRKRWVQYKATEPDDEVVDMIDRALATNDYTQNREYIDALLPPGAAE